MARDEDEFYQDFKNIFIGAKVEGNSGFVNLMKIKSNYFEKILKSLKSDIDTETTEFPEFKDELFTRLHTFFKTYFSESGSIYFSYTPLRSKVYEKIYTNHQDVILFWKTNMLYYVKTDNLYKSLSIGYEVEGSEYTIKFDASQIEGKRANERRIPIFELDGVNNKSITFRPQYSEHGKETKISEILKELHKSHINLTEQQLDELFKTFKKQTEVDYFINKDAKAFLREQFDLWLKNYIFDDESDYSERRLEQLKILKNIAYKVIDFVAQFEDELAKIWNKPKFVLNSNYVVTLDRIANKQGGIELIGKILSHKGIDEQIKEWKDLGVADENFNPKPILQNNISSKTLNENHKFLYIDTKYFKDLELNILSLFEDLDNELDGRLIHSENYQALNTILPKFKEKVQTIYIDPPFNKEQNADYLYNVKYKDSTWATMLENRLSLAKYLLKDTGSIFVRSDYNGNMFLRLLMNEIFREDNFRNEITVGKTPGKKKTGLGLSYTKDYLLFYGKTQNSVIKELWKNTETFLLSNKIMHILKEEKDIPFKKLENVLKENLFWVDLDHRPGERKENKIRILLGIKFEPPEGRHWIKSQEKLNELYESGKCRIKCKNCGKTFYNKDEIDDNCCSSKRWVIQIFLDEEILGDNWTDISGYSQSDFLGIKFPTENSEILLNRVIELTSHEGDLIMDFFLGSGTTSAVAHKLGRKWIGVEMGEHFYSVVLPRMKRVLVYDKSGISKEKDVKEKYNENKAGGFFEYFDLEQYEQTLRKCHYIPSEPFFDLDDKSIYEQYVFMKDPKLLDATELDYQKNKIAIKFNDIYPNIDIVETLSNLKSKWIKRITENSVILRDDRGDEEVIRFDNVDFKAIKPLIWW